MIFLDFETFSEVDLKKTGLSRYAEDPSTEVLCLAWAIDDDEPSIWIQGDLPPHRLFEAINSHMLSAFNAQFEMAIWRYVCVRRMGWPKISDEKWMDTQADALALGLPADMDRCSKALGLPEKDDYGHRIMLKLSKPRKPTKNNPAKRWLKEVVHEDYLHLYAYCKQDVRVERSIAKRLQYRVTASGHPERAVWQETVRMNQAGIPIDVVTLNRLNILISEKLYRLTTEMQTLTEGAIDTAKQAQAIKKWLEPYIDLPDMQGATLLALDLNTLPEVARKVILCFVQASYASIAKYKKMSLQLCKDLTIKDNLRFHGAATGRDAGMGVQVQNFPRASVEDPEFAIECVQDYDLETIEALYGNILELASALIRPMLKAPEGQTFFNADLSQIEARMRTWIAREEDYLQGYRDGKDPYRVIAAQMFNLSYDELTKKDPRRQAGKVSDLSLGFQGGKRALISMAADYGIFFSENEAQGYVNAFREAHPKLVRTWHAFGDAAITAIQNPGNQVPVDTNHSFSFLFKDEFLFMQMPNGKLLSFPFAKYELWMMPWGKRQMGVTHMWINTKAGSKWERRGISGASLMQSAVQGLSGSLLMEANLRLVKQGYDVRFRVHDELTAIVRDDLSSNLDHFTKVFTQVPAWAEGLPVEADPWKHNRYKK